MIAALVVSEDDGNGYYVLQQAPVSTDIDFYIGHEDASDIRFVIVEGETALAAKVAEMNEGFNDDDEEFEFY